MKLKPMVVAVRRALAYLGEQWRAEQWYREHSRVGGAT